MTLYRDDTRQVTALTQQYRAKGELANARLMAKISDQPGTTWLVGPSATDPTANADIAAVQRTSAAAKAQGTLPVYELYAIPNRDACAEYSKNGFTNTADYLAWVNRVLGALQTKAVFSVEADAVAQASGSNCMQQAAVDERYALLSATMQRLADHPSVLAAYLDAGHPEWFPDPKAILEPLQRSGLQYADGIATNVSFNAATKDVTKWSQRLVALAGGNKGVIIDTSRNGQGSPDSTVTGEARWCNAKGRGLGQTPTTDVTDTYIDAYLWVKIIGESDGSCFGNPPAGTFVPALALDLASRAKQ